MLLLIHQMLTGPLSVDWAPQARPHINTFVHNLWTRGVTLHNLQSFGSQYCKVKLRKKNAKEICEVAEVVSGLLTVTTIAHT